MSIVKGMIDVCSVSLCDDDGTDDSLLTHGLSQLQQALTGWLPSLPASEKHSDMSSLTKFF